MSSDEEFYEDEYDDDSAPFYDEDSEDDEDYGLGSAVYDEELTLRPRQPRFTVLSEGDILARQAEAVKDVATVLSIESSAAAILLRHFKWSVSQVNDEWFHNEERVRKAVGLLSLSDDPKQSPAPSPSPSPRKDSPPSPSSRQRHDKDKKAGEAEAEEEVMCGICFEGFPRSELKPATCNCHFFCTTCWEGYISTGIADGPGCLNMRCPDPNCDAAVRESFVMELAPDALRSKYKRYVLRSYVDDNRNAKWCPAPGCEFAVEFFPDSSNYDVVCKCGHNFCWSCNEEAHRPVDCDTVAKWILKNSAESENMNWILAHSKACPKCKRPIEKNLGCMHMTCTPPCKHEFCWLCLGAWSEHGEKTGGFYACNRYEAARHKGMYDEAERRKEMAMNSLEKYTHYYERWAANEQSRMKAIESLKDMQATKIETLSERQSQPISQLKFVTDAWLQVVECRRVLKWTYAYGYYLPMEEHAKRQFFEYLQGEADSALENLHRMAEKELEKYLEPPGVCAEGAAPELPFSEFKSRLAGLTSVTHTYFENLVRALENGLADVEQSPLASASGARAQHPHAQPSQGAGKRDKRSATASGSGQAASATGTGAGTAAGTGTGTGGQGGSGHNSSSSRGGTGSAMARLAKAAVRGGRSSSNQSGGGIGLGLGGTSSGGGGLTGRGLAVGGSGSSSSARAQQEPAAGGGMRTASPLRQAEEPSYWSCAYCTYANRSGTSVCSMCNLPRGNAR